MLHTTNPTPCEIDALRETAERQADMAQRHIVPTAFDHVLHAVLVSQVKYWALWVLWAAAWALAGYFSE